MTVNERSKLNGGFISGPKHKFKVLSNPEVKKEEVSAPNYRESEGFAERCLNCSNYDDQDKGPACMKHDMPVKKYYVCDDFSDEESGEPEKDEPESQEAT